MLLDTNKRVAGNYERHVIFRAFGDGKVEIKKL
jgi:hypothetical protein